MRKARLFGQACLTLLLIVFIGIPPVKAQILVTIPALTAGVGETITVPVDLGNVEATGMFNSFQFRVVSSSSNLVFIGHEIVGTLSEAWAPPNGSIVSDPLASKLVGGFAPSSNAIGSSGTLINLVFQLDAVEANITVELQEFKLTFSATQLANDPVIPSGEFTISTDAEEEGSLPNSFVLRGNYPNPFNPTTNIQFDLPQAAEVEVSIMDILGREMITLPAQTMAAGAGQTVSVDAQSLASGIYIYRIVARSANDMHVASGTMTLIK